MAALASNLRGVCYVLDEPTVGLHPRDDEALTHALLALRDRGNTVVVVEHEESVIRAADHLIDLGPGAGPHGGRLVAEGSPREVARVKESLTGRWLRGAGEQPPWLRRGQGGCSPAPRSQRPVSDSFTRATSRGEPCATSRPPCGPAPWPRSIRWSAARITLSSCSTTTTVLPRSRSASRAWVSASSSRGWSPTVGSSST